MTIQADEFEKLTTELEEMKMSWQYDFPTTIELLGKLLPELERIGIAIYRLEESPNANPAGD